MTRPRHLLLPVLLFFSPLSTGCGGTPPPVTVEPPHLGTGPKVTVTGLAFAAGPLPASVVGADVTTAEDSSFSTTVGADGTFRLTVPSGGEASFVMHQPGFPELQTATLLVPSEGLEHVAFQAISSRLLDVLSALVATQLDPAMCQVATTVSALGTDLYGGDGLGVPDTVVTIDPPLPPEHGPFYFRYVRPGLIVPDTTLKATTLDGGTFFTNIPPGYYRLRASHPGKRFTSVKLYCRAGILLNAAPPWGIQEL